MSPGEPKVTNALLRCTRKDRKAHPLFESIRDDLGWWVWELGPFGESGWNEWLATTRRLLRENMEILGSLKTDSTDYTLHIAIAVADHSDFYLFRLPQELITAAHEAGFGIEFFHETEAPLT